VARVAHVGIALLLLLDDRHRDLGQIVEHQVVDGPLLHLATRRLEPIAPEALSRSDTYNTVSHRASGSRGGNTNGPTWGVGFRNAARRAIASTSRVSSG